MKKVIISVSIFLASFYLQQIFAEEEFCAKQGTQVKMSFREAKQLALKSNCLKVGKLKDSHWCNEITGTWWISLKTKMQNCHPACVINIVDKTTSVNYMCMGLIRSQKASNYNQH